jgi:hypothetical protein
VVVVVVLVLVLRRADWARLAGGACGVGVSRATRVVLGRPGSRLGDDLRLRTTQTRSTQRSTQRGGEDDQLSSTRWLEHWHDDHTPNRTTVAGVAWDDGELLAAAVFSTVMRGLFGGPGWVYWKRARTAPLPNDLQQRLS